MMRDYSNRLVSLSWHFLTPEECQERAEHDIDEGFRFCDLRAGHSGAGYFDPDRDLFKDLVGRHNTLLDCLQVDLLRPTYDYYALKYNSLLYVLLDVSYHIQNALITHGVEPRWSMVYCTTKNDSPVSAMRRTLVFPNCGFDGAPIDNTPRSADLPIELLAQLEDDLETVFARELPRHHYA